MVSASVDSLDKIGAPPQTRSHSAGPDDQWINAFAEFFPKPA